MKDRVVIILCISLIVVCFAVVATYANTPVSDVPLWVYWLIK